MTAVQHYINEAPFIDRIVLTAFPFGQLDSLKITSLPYKKCRNALRHNSVKDTQSAIAALEMFGVNEILSI